MTSQRSSKWDNQPLSARNGLRTLRSRIAGRLLTPADAEHAQVSGIWNSGRQRYPAVIVQCTGADDVVAAVGYAREAGLPLAVRGSGYAPSGVASTAGFVIDTRVMNDVAVNRSASLAVVGAGATWGDIDPATQQHGLAVPGVPLAGIGVAGSTLAGGYGYLRRAYGLACDSLVTADVVTAAGELVRAAGDVNSELLWGLRGGGGNFGVVTSMTFRLRPVPGPLLSGAVFVAAQHVGELLDFYRDYTATLRDDVTTRFSLLSAQHSTLRTHMVGVLPSVPVAAIVVACLGDPVEAEQLIKPIRRAVPVLLDTIGRYPYAQLQAGADAGYRPGLRAEAYSCYLRELDDTLIDDLVARHQAMPAGSCELQLDHMGGAVGRVAPMSTAAPNRSAPYVLHAMARWSTRASGAAQRGWLRDTTSTLHKHSVGGPQIGMAAPHDSAECAYGHDRYVRLGVLKARYDPANIFASNLNIAPLV